MLYYVFVVLYYSVLYSTTSCYYNILYYITSFSTSLVSTLFFYVRLHCTTSSSFMIMLVCTTSCFMFYSALYHTLSFIYDISCIICYVLYIPSTTYSNILYIDAACPACPTPAASPATSKRRVLDSSGRRGGGEGAVRVYVYIYIYI